MQMIGGGSLKNICKAVSSGLWLRKGKVFLCLLWSLDDNFFTGTYFSCLSYYLMLDLLIKKLHEFHHLKNSSDSKKTPGKFREAGE
jgi:hypothetical protein